jgi:VWFA-related protein
LEEDFAVKPWVSAIALAALFGMTLPASEATPPQSQQSSPPNAPVPNAPTPQEAQPLPGAQGPIIPGKGTPLPEAQGSSTSAPATPAAPPPPPANTEPPAQPKDQGQTTPPEQGSGALTRFVVNVNFVEVPVIVKDSKGNPVAGLTFRDFQVYENGRREPLSVFSVDPAPLSIAFVIDQSLPSNIMQKVNESMGAIQGALTSYDEAALFTYSNGSKEWTGFSGAQSARLPAVLSLAQATGTDPLVPINTGPMAGCPVYVNGNCADPNIQPGRSAGNQTFITIPKEIHTLNDAILEAAKELSTRPKDRRRIIYVVSDGKEYGSKATWREVVRYLQTNKTAVYATLVGDSARWGAGWVDRLHLPFTMYDNILYKYTALTGGDMDAEGGVNGIEKSYAKIAEEARYQYTLGYLSHESIYDSKYRTIDVRVNRPNLEVIAKPGYFPSAQDYR